jgi:hypothetical protein
MKPFALAQISGRLGPALIRAAFLKAPQKDHESRQAAKAEHQRSPGSKKRCTEAFFPAMF